MEEGAALTASAGARLSTAPGGPRRNRDWLPWTVAAALGMALITMAWFSRRVEPTTPGDVVEFPIESTWADGASVAPACWIDNAEPSADPYTILAPLGAGASARVTVGREVPVGRSRT